jgi:hypothetical protein
MIRWRLEVHDQGRNHTPFNKFFDDLGAAKRYVERKQLPRKGQFYGATLYEIKPHNKPEEWYMNWDRDGKTYDRGDLAEEKRKREEMRLFLKRLGIER